MNEEAKLKKVLTLTDVMSVAFGQTVGAGIIVLTGVAINMTGAGVVPSYFLAALIILFGTIPLAVLGSVMPATGGLYQYTSRLWSEKTGFFYLLLIIPQKVAISMYALTFAAYFKSIMPDANTQVVAFGALVVMYVCNLLGVKAAVSVLKFMLINLILALGLFLFYGLPQVHLETFAPENIMPKGTWAFLSTTALLSFATGGAFFVSELGGEMKNPKRDIPITIISITLFVGFLYAITGMVAAGVLPIAEVAGKPLSIVAKVILPNEYMFKYFIIGGALLSVGKMLLLAFTQGTKAILMGAIHGWLPEPLSRVNKRFGTPHVLQTLFFLIGAVPIMCGFSIESIAKLVTAIATTGFCFSVTGAYFLPDKYPNLFKDAVFSFTPKGFKRMVIISSIIMMWQAFLLLAGLNAELLIALAAYFIIAFIIVRKAPNRNIVFTDATEAEEGKA